MVNMGMGRMLAILDYAARDEWVRREGGIGQIYT
jgi:hypothetical protein